MLECLLLLLVWSISSGSFAQSAGAPSSSTTTVHVTAPTANTSVASSATKAAAPAAIVPLQTNGLISRMLRAIGAWVDGLGVQARATGVELSHVWSMFKRSGWRIGNDLDRAFLLQAGELLAIVFGTGLLVEWTLHWLFRAPLSRLARRADLAEARGSAADARVEAREREAEHAPIATASEAVTAGTQPMRADVAVVRTQQHGVDEVEEVPVGKKNTQRERFVTAVAKSTVSRLPTLRPGAYVRALRRLCYAFLAGVMNLLPLAAFFLLAGVLLHTLPQADERSTAIVAEFVNAYVFVRFVMAVLRLLLSPQSEGLRVWRVQQSTAAVLESWLRAMVALAAFGLALGDVLSLLGATAAGREAFLKMASLLVHVAWVILILRLRRQATRAIAAPPRAHGPLALARNALARAWTPLAITVVMGTWFVWAFSVADGFPRLLHVIGTTAAILIAARIASILLQGTVARAFHVNAQAPAEPETSARVRLSRRYYPFAKGMTSFFIAMATVLGLFQNWGWRATRWFAQGTLGRGLGAAALTIFVAMVITVAIWEAASLAMERRIDSWTERGDTMRAARLRTLLPMLRSCLLVGVIIVVGLTALNQIGINTAPLLASASIVGVALGFGSQKLVQDFITGVFLLMENAMQVGDNVTVAGVSGTVEALSVRTVRLRGGDGSLYTVPFSSVTTVNNTNRGLGNAAVRVSVAYESDIERAIAELKDIGKALRADPAFKAKILKDIEVWGVDSMDGSRVTLIGQMQCTDAGRWGVQREINRRIVKRFSEKSIELANPRTSFLMTPAGAASPAAANEERDAQENR